MSSTSSLEVRHVWWRRAMNDKDPIFGKDFLGAVKGLCIQQCGKSRNDNLVYVCDGGYKNRMIILKSLEVL